jgi:hypothetical protein
MATAMPLRSAELTTKPLDRDQNLRFIRKHGRKRWKQTSGYHQRSKAETGILRYKTILGDSLSSRLFENQCVEMKLGAKILNKISALGMPVSLTVLA